MLMVWLKIKLLLTQNKPLKVEIFFFERQFNVFFKLYIILMFKILKKYAQLTV
jgi:hypothetical protein